MTEPISIEHSLQPIPAARMRKLVRYWWSYRNLEYFRKTGWIWALIFGFPFLISQNFISGLMVPPALAMLFSSLRPFSKLLYSINAFVLIGTGMLFVLCFLVTVFEPDDYGFYPFFLVLGGISFSSLGVMIRKAQPKVFDALVEEFDPAERKQTELLITSIARAEGDAHPQMIELRHGRSHFNVLLAEDYALMVWKNMRFAYFYDKQELELALHDEATGSERRKGKMTFDGRRYTFTIEPRHIERYNAWKSGALPPPAQTLWVPHL